jgi:hypothetical protein
MIEHSPDRSGAKDAYKKGMANDHPSNIQHLAASTQTTLTFLPLNSTFPSVIAKSV